MDKPKVTETAVGADQVVRDLVDALKSIQKKPAPLSSSPPGELGRPIPSESQRGRSKATTLLPALPGVSAPDEPESEQVFELESAPNSERRSFEVERGGIIQGFCRIHGTVERFRVTPQEFRALSNASLLGSWTCEQDARFMLRQIREASESAEPQATVTPEEISVPILLDRASVHENAENGSPGPSGNENEESVEFDRLPENGKDKSHDLGVERNGLSGEVASQLEPPRTSTGTKAAIYISIASLVLWVASLGVLYKLADAYRKHVTTIATLTDIIGKQRQISDQAISTVQAHAAAAKQASQAAESRAESIKTLADGSKTDADAAKTQADAAALSARDARDMVVIAEAAHVTVDAIYCSPATALSLDTVLKLRYGNSGRTRAENFQSSFWYGIPPDASSAEEPTDPAGGVKAASIDAGGRIVGETTGTVGDILSKDADGVPSKETLQKILAGQLKFGIWGEMTYTDALKEKHQENFEYVWDRNFPNACLFTAVHTSSQ